MESLNNENMWEKMAKHLAGESSVDEQAEIEVNMDSDEGFKNSYGKATETWDLATYAMQYKSIDGDAAFSNIKAQMGQVHNQKQMSFRWIWAAAAVLLAVLSVGMWLWGPLNGSPEPQMALISVEASNDACSFTLTDGSTVNLNKGSQLSYPESFEPTRRDVKLSGEAFFEVAPNKRSPFFIEAGDVVVRVVGTSFNVKAVQSSQLVEVTVEEGVVEVTGKSDKVTLTKGLKAVFDASTGLLEKSVNTDVNYNAWKTRKLVFNETTLGDVFGTLKNVYHVDFVVVDPMLLNARLTASFNNQSAEYVSKVVALTFNLKMVKTDNAFVFSREVNDEHQ